MNPAETKIDALICVEDRDIDRLFRLSLATCVRNFAALNNIFIVTNAKKRLVAHLTDPEVLKRNVTILEDHEVLSPKLYELPGWYRQQVIKLHADKIVKTRFVACLGADTIILRPVQLEDIIDAELPVLYYNRDEEHPGYLEYERVRVLNVAKILRARPIRALLYGDFIMDFNILNRDWLIQLRRYLSTLYGDDPFSVILPNKYPITPAMKKAFGEWTLYATFLLDVLKLNLTIKNSNSVFLAQVQNEAQLQRFQFNSRIVHFVKKDFDLQYITSRLEQFGFSRHPEEV